MQFKNYFRANRFALSILASGTDYAANQAKEFLLGCEGGNHIALDISSELFTSSIKTNPKFLKLPFENCVIEFDFVTTKGAMVVLARQLEHGIEMRAMLKTTTGWVLIPVVGCLRPSSANSSNLITEMLFLEGATYGTRKQDESSAISELKDVMMNAECAVIGLINILACSNVKVDKVEPRKPNKSADKSGALPFDSYHVLTVEPRTETGEKIGTGSTRRTYREHLRRGTICTNKSGKTWWRQSSLVNHAVGGKISKSYVVGVSK